MADKSFGVKDINLIGASGTPEIESPNNLNINAVNVAISTDMSVGGDVGIGTASPIKKLDVRGEATFGEGIQESDLGPWGTDTNQRAYLFSGALSATGANSDGTIALVNPNNNPSNTRVGTIVFGNSVSGTSATSNSGLKAAIDVYTNANVTNAADTGASLRFLTRPDNGNLREVARFNSSGNLVFPSGQGIDFSATSNANGTMSSELLDDYEEGTWTPTVISAGSIGTPQYTCTYTKIGRLVTINADIHALTNTTSSSNIVCGGLPFIPSGTGGEWSAVCHGERYNASHIVAIVQYNSGWRIRFRTGVGSGNYSDLTHAAINDNGTDNNLRFTLTYEVI